MAVSIVHSRTATLVDSGANPGYDANEIQAADWNDAHPITADGMGLLFADSAGDVAETMTVDTGAITASNPFTFKQIWNNASVDFLAFRIDIDDVETGAGGAFDSNYMAVRVANGTGPEDSFRLSARGIQSKGNLRLYSISPAQTLDDPTPAIELNSGTGSFVLKNGPATGTYGASSFRVNDGFGSDTIFAPDGIYQITGSAFFLPKSQIELAAWTAVPTTSNISSGYAQVGKDGTSGACYLAANDGGTIEIIAGKYVANVGDGSNTQYTLTHNFGTRDVTVEVFRNSGNYDTVIPDVERTSTNAVRLTFAVAPTTNEYRCVIRA